MTMRWNMAWLMVPLVALWACGQNGDGGGKALDTEVPAAPEAAAPVEYEVTNGPYKLYDPEGRLQLDGTMAGGQRHGVWTSYFPDGRVRSRTEYSNGKLHGVTTAFRPNGRLYYTGEHRNDREVGTWRFYNDHGDLARTVVYDTAGNILSDTGEGN